jgi:hypothetical protein
VAVGVAASVVGLVGGAFLLVGAADIDSDVRPPAERFTFQQASTVDDVPLGVGGIAGFSTPSYVRP